MAGASARDLAEISSGRASASDRAEAAARARMRKKRHSGHTGKHRRVKRPR